MSSASAEHAVSARPRLVRGSGRTNPPAASAAPAATGFQSRRLPSVVSFLRGPRPFIVQALSHTGVLWSTARRRKMRNALAQTATGKARSRTGKLRGRTGIDRSRTGVARGRMGAARICPSACGSQTGIAGRRPRLGRRRRMNRRADYRRLRARRRRSARAARRASPEAQDGLPAALPGRTQPQPLFDEASPAAPPVAPPVA